MDRSIESRLSPEVGQVRGHVVQLELERAQLAVPRLPGDVFRCLRALVLPGGGDGSCAAAPVGVRELGVRRADPHVVRRPGERTNLG
jgi:hypothetical protein